MKQTVYLCIEKDAGVILPAEARVKHFYLKELESFLTVTELSKTQYVIAVTEQYAFIATKFALAYGVSIDISGVSYSLPEYSKVPSTTQIARELIEHSHNETILRMAIEAGLQALLHQIPHHLTYQQASALLESSLAKNVKLDSASATKLFQEISVEFLTSKQQQVKAFIQPKIGGRVKSVTMEYGQQLVDFISKNKGVYVLNGRMGSSKTKNVIKPLFEHFCTSGSKPVLVAPTRALTNELIFDERNYQNVGDRIANISGLASCIISANSKYQFRHFSQESKVTLVEEFEECESLLTASEIVSPGTLARRVELFEHWYKLLNKETVVIADATFSDFSAQQLVELGRDVYIVEPRLSKLNKHKRQVHIYNENTLVELMENTLDSGQRVINFCDGSKKSAGGKFDAVFHRLNKKAYSSAKVDQGYIEKHGQEYLRDIDESIQRFQLHQYSPVITSGVSIESNYVKEINIVSSKTLLPTQLLQSSGRFRQVETINLCFDGTKRFPPLRFDQIFQSEYLSQKERFCDQEFLTLKSDVNCTRVIKRIQHNNSMYYNYEFTVVSMFEMLGYEIINKVPKEQIKYPKKVSHKTSFKAKCCQLIGELDDDYSWTEHQDFGYYNENELTLNESIFEECRALIKFYGVPNSAAEFIDLVKFDDLGQGRRWVINYSELIGHSKSKSLLKDKITQQIVTQILNILNLDVNSFKGKFDQSSLTALLSFINTDHVIIDGKKYRVLHCLNEHHKSLQLPTAYKERIGNLSSKLLKHFFGLRQRHNRAGIEDSKGKRPIEGYKVECKSLTRLIKYHQMYLNNRNHSCNEEPLFQQSDFLSQEVA